VPFSYYQNLSRRDRAIYRKSDALPDVRLNVSALRSEVQRLEMALSAEDRRTIGAALRALARGLVKDLGAPSVKAIVLARRPSSASSELHGLYSYDDEDTPEIRVWMRTAAHGRVVRFRTFLRTFLHELCHHLDFQLFGLADSFHTEGFFKRESSLMRQLAPPPPKKKKAPKEKALKKKESVVVEAKASSRQLELF